MLSTNHTPWTPILILTTWSYPVVVAFVLLWIFVNIVCVIALQRYKKGFEWAMPHHRLWHSIWPKLSPYILLTTRGITLLYVIGVQVSYIIWQKETESIFDYYKFTTWNWGLLIVYFAFAFILSIKEVLRNSLDMFHDKVFREEMGVLGNIVNVLFEVLWPSVFVVSITYWCILIPGALAFGFDAHQDFFSVTHHTANCLVVFVEFALNNIPFHLGHIWIFLFWPSIFCLFTLTVYGYRLEWPYPIMDARVAMALGWYPALLLGNVMCYLFCYGLSRAKRWCVGVPQDEDPEQAPLMVNEEY